MPSIKKQQQKNKERQRDQKELYLSRALDRAPFSEGRCKNYRLRPCTVKCTMAGSIWVDTQLIKSYFWA